jgi:hypothetical protein
LTGHQKNIKTRSGSHSHLYVSIRAKKQPGKSHATVPSKKGIFVNGIYHIILSRNFAIGVIIYMGVSYLNFIQKALQYENIT